MQLTPPGYDSAVESGLRPLEEVVLCRRLPDDHHDDNLANRVGGGRMTTLSSARMTSTPLLSSATTMTLSDVATTTTTVTMTTTTTTTTSSTTITTSSSSQPIRPTTATTTTSTTARSPCRCDEKNTSNKKTLCNCSSELLILNGRKRKLEEIGEEEVGKKERMVNKYSTELEKYRRLLLIKNRLLNNLTHEEKVPLFYLYGDLLLIPRYRWGSGIVGSDRRRTSLGGHDLNTPIDSSASLEASSQAHSRSENPSLVQICPDSQTLEEGGFSSEWFADVMQPVMDDLNKYGVCVVDNFLGGERAEQILGEVMSLHSRGVFHDGQVVSRNVQDQARGIIRGDKITWVTGNEPHCGNIGQLVSVVDTLIAKANHHHDAGELAQYNITWRTRAMVACYPGLGSHYVKHVDNPDGDGRCITAIYYINKNWQPEDGGVLRIYPEGTNQVADVEPKFDRMLFFWSDRRNPHEVLPATVTRYAITVWYLDQSERERYISRVSRGMANT